MIYRREVITLAFLTLSTWGIRSAIGQCSGCGAFCCPEGCPGEGNCFCDDGYLGCSTSDIMVEDIGNVGHCSWGSKDGIAAFTTSNSNCNPGSQKTLYWSWGYYGDKGSLLGQQMYRLKGDRFEQVGMSWVKYAFASLHGSGSCSATCCRIDGGRALPAGCSDTYNAFNHNAAQDKLGPRANVNAVTGEAPALVASCFDPNTEQGIDNICGRVRVRHEDIDPALNPGASYFMENQWVTTCEDLRNNNASYREMVVDEDPDGCCQGATDCAYVIDSAPGSAVVAGLPAIRAWKDADSSVVETDIHLVEDVSANESNCTEDPAIGETCEVEDESLLILATKATDLQNGRYQYEYALYNLNSYSAVELFTVR